MTPIQYRHAHLKKVVSFSVDNPIYKRQRYWNKHNHYTVA